MRFLFRRTEAGQTEASRTEAGNKPRVDCKQIKGYKICHVRVGGLQANDME